jgi:polar amino acid transport system substrate-binding protein
MLAMGLLIAAPSQACTKRLRWVEDPPYTMRLPDGRIGGWSVELAQAVLQRMGCSMTLVELPFARALIELREGRIDMLDGAFALPERQVYAHFSTPVARSRNVVFVRNSDRSRLQGKNLADLHQEGWQFGVQTGVAYGPSYTALEKDPSFIAKRQVVPLRTSLWKMLALGRVDVVLADELTARHELGIAKLADRITATDLVISDAAASMAFSKRTTDLAFVQRFNAAFEAMQADGSYDRLRQRYGLISLEAAPAKR